MKKTKTELNKGDYGYLAKRKKLMLILTIVAFSIVLAVLLTGVIIHHNRKNIFTVGAILLTLPAAKILVNYLLFVKHKPITEEKYNKISQITDARILYDSVISVNEKVFFVPFIALNSTNILVYTPYTKLTAAQIEKGIGEFISVNGFRPQIKVINDEKVFMKRLETLKSDETDIQRLVENLMILHV